MASTLAVVRQRQRLAARERAARERLRKVRQEDARDDGGEPDEDPWDLFEAFPD
jgi:hypothetical protein